MLKMKYLSELLVRRVVREDPEPGRPEQMEAGAPADQAAPDRHPTHQLVGPHRGLAIRDWQVHRLGAPHWTGPEAGRATSTTGVKYSVKHERASAVEAVRR